MTVQRLRSASRVLSVLEAIAQNEPIGVGALARLLDDNKSAVQRALMTLADDGWIRVAPGPQTRWELTSRIHILAHMAQGHTELRQRVRLGLDVLRNETGESIILAVPEAGRLVAIDVLESRQMVRTAPYIGLVIPASGSSAGQAVLAHMTDDERFAFLGAAPSKGLKKSLDIVAKRGWALNDGDIVEGSTQIGAAILSQSAKPVAAIVISAPSDRTPRARQETLGALLAETAVKLSEHKTPGPRSLS